MSLRKWFIQKYEVPCYQQFIHLFVRDSDDFCLFCKSTIESPAHEIPDEVASIVEGANDFQKIMFNKQIHSDIHLSGLMYNVENQQKCLGAIIRDLYPESKPAMRKLNKKIKS